MDRPEWPARRWAMKRGAGAGLAVVAALMPGRPVHALQKMTKGEAQYQDHPKDIQMCSTCTLFVKPSACKAVEGEVSPDGWCRLFDMVD